LTRGACCHHWLGSNHSVTGTVRLTLIDNYDSFTFNLVHLLGAQGCEVEVVRNDQTTVDSVIAAAPDAIVISPGPCTPMEAGICCDLVRAAGAEIPILGVCLGHQTIGHVEGGEVRRAPEPRHGKVSAISHSGMGIFKGLNRCFSAARYHSLIVARDTLPTALDVTAETADGLIMGLQHRSKPLHGVQFHPESIASEHGAVLAQNFLSLAAAWNASSRSKN
jgi:anthranilate synthase component II